MIDPHRKRYWINSFDSELYHASLAMSMIPFFASLMFRDNLNESAKRGAIQAVRTHAARARFYLKEFQRLSEEEKQVQVEDSAKWIHNQSPFGSEMPTTLIS